MAYIASAPVRFDRDYKIGEIIPPEAVDPKRVNNLIRMGKIIAADIPAAKPKQETNGTDGSKSGPDNSPEDEGPQADSAEPTEILPGSFDVEQLATWKNSELEKLAADLGVDISKARNKSERAQLIAVAEIQHSAKDGEAGEDSELPSE